MEKQAVTYSLRDGIAYIGLNRPNKCNAVDADMAEQLHKRVSQANASAIACIVFGHGSHFCAGLDLNWIREHLESNAKDSFSVSRGFSGQSALNLIADSHIPYIAAIHGATIGLGFELAATCHIRVADETAVFALPEAQHGIFVGGGGAVRISRLMGVARMQDMMLTGREYSATEAERSNIAQYVVSDGEAQSKATELALLIQDNSPSSNAAIVRGLPRIYESSVADGLFWESVLANTTIGGDTTSRLRSFLNRSRSL